MIGRLQFLHCNRLFQTADLAKSYIESKIGAGEITTLLGEPIVLKYGETEDSAKLLICVGVNSDNKLQYFDYGKIEMEINSMSGSVEEFSALTFTVKDSTSIDFEKKEVDGHQELTGNVKVSSKSNALSLSSEGLLSKVEIGYDDDEQKLTLTSNGTTQYVEIPENKAIASGKYVYTGADAGKIVLTTVDGDEVKIDISMVAELISVEGTGSTTPIVLTKKLVRVLEDGESKLQNVLQADVRISPYEHNILQKDNSGQYLYVNGSADNIYCTQYEKEVTLQYALDHYKTPVSTQSGNIIVLKADGVYASMEIGYNTAKNQLNITLPDGTVKTIQLNSTQILDDASYNSAQETIELRFITASGEYKVLSVPVKDIIEEWAVDNSNATVTLTRERNVAGTDRLTANVNVSDNDVNILQIDRNHNLYVDGRSNNIQYNEKSTVKDALDELFNYDNALSGEVSTAKNNIEELFADVVLLQKKDDELDAKDAELEAKDAELEAKDANLQSQIDTLKEKDNSLGVEILNLSNDLDELSGKVENYNTTLANSINALDNEDKNLQSQIDAVKNSVTTVNTQITELKGEDSLINQKISGLTNDIDGLKEQGNDLQSQIGNITNDVNSINTKITELEGADDVLDQKISGLSSTQNEKNLAQDNAISALRDNVSELNSGLTNANTAISSNTLKIQSLESSKKTFASSTTIKVDDTNNVITPSIKLANDTNNIITMSDDNEGITANASLTYNAAKNTLSFSTTNGSYDIVLNAGTVIDDLKYDEANKTLIFIYTTSAGTQNTITVPVRDLFNDWKPENQVSGSAIELIKEEGVSGDTDILKARVIVSAHEDNALVIDGNALYVSKDKLGITQLNSEVKEISGKVDTNIEFAHDFAKAITGKEWANEMSDTEFLAYAYDAYSGTPLSGSTSFADADTKLYDLINNAKESAEKYTFTSNDTVEFTVEKQDGINNVSANITTIDGGEF